MLTTIRAGISVGLLVGFYVLAVGLIGGLAWATVWLFRGDYGTGAAKLGYFTLALAAAVVIAMWQVARAKPQAPDGIAVSETVAPYLWREVRDLAGRVGTRMPDEIRLVAEVNAAVSEDSRLLGLRTGRRYLYVGTPLLSGLTVSQMRAVLAHELGHYSHSHTRLGPLTYRGRMAIGHTIEQVGPNSLAGRLFRGYGRIYVLVQNSVSRRQEREADQAATRIAGRQATATALRELEPIGATWTFYLNNYVGWGLETGYAPADVVRRFDELLAGRRDELVELRAAPPSKRGSRWDTHPPIGERVALIEREHDVNVVDDPRPAAVLVPSLAELAREVEDATFDFGQRQRVPFEEYTARAAQAAHQTDADVLYRAATRAGGGSGGTLAGVLDALEQGRLGDLMSALFRPAQLAGSPRDAAESFHDMLTSALSVALVDAGAAFWHHSWRGPATLRDRGGSEIDVAKLAAQATTGQVAQVRQELAARGVDLYASTASSARPTATGADFVAAISDVRIDKPFFDLLILDNGLLFVPRPGKPSMNDNTAKPRLGRLVSSASPAELAARPGTVFVAFEDVATAQMTRKIPLAFAITRHDGSSLAWKHTLHSEELGEGIQALVSNLAAAMPA